MSGTVTLDKDEYDGMVEKIRVLSSEESYKVKNLSAALDAIEHDGAYRLSNSMYAFDSMIPRHIYTRDELNKRLACEIEKLKSRNLIQRILNKD